MVNDENVRPDKGPNDSDRARFGFVKRISQADVTMSTVATPCRSSQSASRDATPNTDNFPQVSILRKVEQALGDPDAPLPMCRAKLTAKKFDFRSRVAELTEQNQALKRALFQNRQQHKALIVLLSPVEAEMLSDKLQLQFLSDKLQERGKLSHELKENLKEYHEEYVRPFREMNDNTGRLCEDTPLRVSPRDVAGADCEDVAVRKAAYDILRRCGEAEARRADAAEATVKTLHQELSQTRACMQDLKQEVARARKIARNASADAKLQIGEAERLVAQQLREATSARQELLRIAQERQTELLQELAAVKARMRSQQGQASTEGRGADVADTSSCLKA